MCVHQYAWPQRCRPSPLLPSCLHVCLQCGFSISVLNTTLTPLNGDRQICKWKLSWRVSGQPVKWPNSVCGRRKGQSEGRWWPIGDVIAKSCCPSGEKHVSPCIWICWFPCYIVGKKLHVWICIFFSVFITNAPTFWQLKILGWKLLFDFETKRFGGWELWPKDFNLYCFWTNL